MNMTYYGTIGIRRINAYTQFTVNTLISGINAMDIGGGLEIAWYTIATIDAMRFEYSATGFRGMSYYCSIGSGSMGGLTAFYSYIFVNSEDYTIATICYVYES